MMARWLMRVLTFPGSWSRALISGLIQRQSTTIKVTGLFCPGNWRLIASGGVERCQGLHICGTVNVGTVVLPLHTVSMSIEVCYCGTLSYEDMYTNGKMSYCHIWMNTLFGSFESLSISWHSSCKVTSTHKHAIARPSTFLKTVYSC